MVALENKQLNEKIKEYMALVEQRKMLEKAVEAAKEYLMGFAPTSTDQFAMMVAVTPVERVVGKADLIAKLGEELVRKLELTKTTEARSLKISAK